MKYHRLLMRRILTASFALILMTGLAVAMTVIIPSDEELIIGARAIIKGRVVSMLTRYNEDRGMVYTYVTVEVNEVWKGAIRSHQIVLKQPGGIANGHGTLFNGTPEFSIDERVLLFLDTWADGSLRVHQFFLGKFDISTGSDGTTQVVRATGGEGVKVVGQSSAGPATERMDLDKFESLIRARVAASSEGSAAQEARYPRTPIRAYPPEYVPVADSGEAPIPNFVFLSASRPLRWAEADNGTPISYIINTAMPPTGNYPAYGTASETATDVLSALGVLSSVSGSSLRMVGTIASSGACGLRALDGNSVSFNNCDNYFSPTSCTGVLAVGGVVNYYLTNTQLVSGTTFYRIAEGDVSINPYASCYFSDHCRVQEVLTHELGHTIGLGHSPDYDATMAAVAHFDGRCAGLKDDDRAGIRFIYPALSSGPTPTPTPTPTPLPTPTPTPLPTPTPTPLPTPTPTPVPTPTPTPVPTPTPTPVPTPTPTPTPAPTPSTTPTPIPPGGPIWLSPNPMVVCDGSGVASTTLRWQVPSTTSVQIRRDSSMGGLLFQGSSIGSMTLQVTNGVTFFVLSTATRSVYGSVTAVVTSQGCGSPTPTPTPVPTPTPTPVPTPTPTPVPTPTPTPVPTPTPTPVPTPTPTPVPTPTPTPVPTPTPTPVPTPTPTPVPTPTPTPVPTPTPTPTPAPAPTPSAAPTPVPMSGPIWLNQNPVQSCDGTASVLIRWQSTRSFTVQIRRDTALGELVAYGSSVGTFTTGDWVTNGTRFVLVDSSTRATLGSVTAYLTNYGCGQ